VALPPQLQVIFDEIMATHPQGLTLDELSDELAPKGVSYGDVELIIEALEDAGVDLSGPGPVARPEELARALVAARALAAETGKRPSVEEIAERAGLTPAGVRRALRLGRSAGGTGPDGA
jgi:hypothetical protein